MPTGQLLRTIMKLNKLSLCIAIAATVSISAHANTAKSLGKGMTGVTGDFTSATSNPSLINNFKSNDDVYFTIGFGASFKDGDETLDSLEAGADAIDALDESLESFNSQLSVASAQELASDAKTLDEALTKLDGNMAQIGTGINFMVAVPNNFASLAVFGNQTGRFSAHLDYDAEDSKTLNDVIDAVEGDHTTATIPEFTADSTLVLNGYSVTDLGLIVGRNQTVYGQPINFGGALKYQRIDLVQIEEGFDEESDDFDTEDALTTDNGFNIDLGMDTAFGAQGQYKVGLVAKNLIKREVEGKQGDVFTLDPSVTVGLGYDIEWFSANLEADVMEHTGFEGMDKLHEVKAGIELDAWGHAQLRAGYKMDLNDDEAGVVTAGIGISPWDVVAVDVGAFVGEGDSMGASLQLGFKI